MPLGELHSRTTTGLHSAGTSSRVKFVGRQESAAIGAVSVLTTPTHRVSFLQPAQQATPPRPSGRSQSDIHLTDRQCAKTVPELSYELDSGCNITATMSDHLCRSLIEHCGESNVHGREVGGVLIGYRCERRGHASQEYRLVVTDLIRIESFDSSSAHICFTESAWARAEGKLRARFAPEGKCRLGWYHTHPVQGIFFSTQDQNAHAIFAEAYQFALVVDPRRMEAGLFYWSSYRDRGLAGPIQFPLVRGAE